MTWREYWNGPTPIYVNACHLRVHYAAIADDILGLLREWRDREAVVLDYGCGEALSADRIAGAVRQLYLSDGAALVRRHLAERLQSQANITILAPEEMDRLPPQVVDLAVVNSLLQYLPASERDQVLGLIRTKLKPSGRLIVADVVPPDLGMLADVTALLKFAAANGFLLAALAGLPRAYFSDYRSKRAELGLATYSEAQMLDILARTGFEARRLANNLGHNPRRMAFEARPQLGTS